MTIREQNEQREHAVLEPWATFADSSAGRLRPMEPCPYRTCFQRDRDRIIHSKGVPAAGQQDAGIYLAGGRPLPCSADAHARGRADCADHRAGARTQRGFDRSDRTRT